MIYKEVISDLKKILWPRNLKLFTAGPVSCFPEVLEVMKIQMFSHRSKEYKELHKDTIERLSNFVEAKKSTVMLFPCSGTGIMEATIRNFVNFNSKVLVTIIGEFGKRYSEVVKSNGREVIILEKPYGNPVLPDDLDEALKKNKDVEAVTITHNETSSGVLNPLKELVKVVKEHNKLVFVDGVSALGATDLKFDEWGIDVYFSSSQKAFGIPPGLAIGIFNEEIFEIAKKIKNRGFYFDLLLYKEDQEKRLGTPTTPPIPQIAGLNVILRIIDKIGGKSEWLKMYKERAEKIRKKILEIGLELFAKPNFYSPTITVVKTPNGINGDDVYEEMRKRGFEIARGYGKARKNTFRIGHMGYITEKDIEDLFINLKEVISLLKI